MTVEDLYQEIKSLPPFYQREIEDFIGFLKTKINMKITESKDKRVIGLGEGKGWMSKDFDAPLDDLKDYM